ncbi:MAG: hypothetical protein M1438_19040 [Deltaproteobacteria bacterium]|nr:hypothetical protein [Deltaproteobacteria bacterium]
MPKFAGILGKLVPSLIAGVVLTAPLPARATNAPAAPGPLLLAQNSEPKAEKAPSQAVPKTAPGPVKSVTPATNSEKMEERTFKKKGMAAPRPLPEASGTKKMGGQIIRDKEAPEDE